MVISEGIRCLIRPSHALAPPTHSIAAGVMDLLRIVPGAPSTNILMQSPVLFAILSRSLKTRSTSLQPPDEMVSYLKPWQLKLSASQSQVSRIKSHSVWMIRH